ncbi:hypothetical protein [Propionivibrio sp.]|uniref:hypothetical protein n=1 Tax=Propionivibrio sp. TaxID=2212460 RepID=UPI0039E6EFCA
MKNRLAAVLLGASLCALSGVVSAQFGNLPKTIPGMASASPGSSVTPEGIVSRYVAGSKHVNNADIKMLRAVGLKDEADRAELQAKNLTEGATKDALEESVKSQTESSKALEARLAGGKVEMDAKSKEMFAAGMADLGRGIVQYAAMSKEASGFKPGPSAIGGSTTSALYVVKTLPDSIRNLASTLKSSMDFAKANNIPVPKEAADATAAI